MKKNNLILIIFFVLYINSFSYIINDYLLFNEAKTLSENGDYFTANLKFRSLKDSFQSSPIVKSNYYAFYMSLNYYKLGDLDKAIFYMQKAIYTPKSLSGKNYFDLERSFYLSKFYYEKGDLNSSFNYLKRLVNIDYSPIAKEYENYAFTTLKGSSENLNILYQIKYKNDFSRVNILSTKDLLTTSKYFIAREEFSQANRVLETLYKREPKNEEVISQYLYTLYSLKEYEKILNLTTKMMTYSNFPQIFYFRGKSLIATKSFSAGIVNLKNFIYFEKKNLKLPFVSDARESIFDIYLSLNNYNEIIIFSKEIKPLTMREKVPVITSNIKLKNYSDALLSISDFIKEYPTSLQSYYYSYMLKKLNYSIDDNVEHISEEFFELPSFKLIGNVINFYISTINDYPINLEKEYSSLKMKTLFDIAALGDPNLLNLEVENTLFISPDSVINSFLMTKIFESSKDYSLAYKNSYKNKDKFSKYRNILPLLYPKYFTKEVEAASKKYDVPEEIIYPVIHIGSGFDPNYAGSMYRFGLMQIPYNPVLVKDISTLKNPDSNIDEGVKRLAYFIKKNKSEIKGLIEYLYGEEVLNSIYFEGDELYLARISDPIIKQKITALIETFLFYKRLYY